MYISLFECIYYVICGSGYPLKSWWVDRAGEQRWEICDKDLYCAQRTHAFHLTTARIVNRTLHIVPLGIKYENTHIRIIHIRNKRSDISVSLAKSFIIYYLKCHFRSNSNCPSFPPSPFQIRIIMLCIILFIETHLHATWLFIPRTT